MGRLFVTTHLIHHGLHATVDTTVAIVHVGIFSFFTNSCLVLSSSDEKKQQPRLSVTDYYFRPTSAFVAIEQLPLINNSF